MLYFPYTYRRNIEMKFLKKINRGLIVTVLILIVLIVYLVVQSISHDSAEPVIKDICEKYISTVTSYKILPEEYMSDNSEMQQADLEKYIQNMTSDIKSFYADNEQNYSYLIKSCKESLENQAKGKEVIYNYKKDIVSFEKIIFNRNTVTVTIRKNNTYNGTDDAVGSIRESISGQTTDTITLQKINGEWKIIYADLQQPDNVNPNEYMYSTY